MLLVMLRAFLLASLVCVAAVGQPGDAQLAKAIAAHQAGNLDGAIAGYREVLKADPGNLTAIQNLGAALSRQGRFLEAIPVYRSGLKRAPGNVPLRINLALAYYKMGDLNDAVRELGEARKLDPANQQAAILLGDTWLQLGESKKVIELLRPFQKRNPGDLGICYLLGTALLSEKHDEEGQVVLDPIFRGGDSAETRLLTGTQKMNNADFPGALVDFSRAVALNPQLPSANAFHGKALMETGDYAGAAEAFRKELALNPYHFVSNLNLAVLLKQERQYDEALALLARALRVRPGDIGVRFQQGAIWLAQGKVEEARKMFEAIVKESPEFTEAHVTLAAIYYRLKRKEDGDRERAAVSRLNQAAQSNPSAEKP